MKKCKTNFKGLFFNDGGPWITSCQTKITNRDTDLEDIIPVRATPQYFTDFKSFWQLENLNNDFHNRCWIGSGTFTTEKGVENNLMDSCFGQQCSLSVSGMVDVEVIDFFWIEEQDAATQ